MAEYRAYYLNKVGRIMGVAPIDDAQTDNEAIQVVQHLFRHIEHPIIALWDGDRRVMVLERESEV